MIYHICRKEDWENALKKGFYIPENFEKEGFIHFSKAEQVCNTANLFYKNVNHLVLLETDDKDDSLVRFENPPDDPVALFPHYYGILPVGKVLRVIPFPQGKNGLFDLPEGVA